MEDHPDARPDAPVARSLWRHARDLVFDAGRDGTLRGASPAGRAWIGDDDATLLDGVHPQDAARLMQLLTGEPPERTEFRFEHRPPEAGWRVLEVTATTPTAHGAVIVARDVTGERQALATLDAHRDVLSLVARAEPLPAALDALARSIEAASGGVRVAVLLARGPDLELVAAPSLRADVAAALTRLRGAAHRDEFPAPGALNGRLGEVASEHGLGFGWVAPVMAGDEPLAVLVLFPGAKRFPNANEQRTLEAAVPLAHVAIASHRLRADAERATRDDPLTGVLARPAFLAELTRLARRSRDVLGILLVQVDGLGALNAHAGFSTGDAVLRAVGARLGATVRGRDIVGRTSGTRFAVACAALGPNASVADFARRVQRVLEEQPVVVDGGLVPVSVRVGAAMRRGRVSDPDALLRDAERVLEQPEPGGDVQVDGGDVKNATPAQGPRDRRSGAGSSDR
jgi:diguanylate cyclase (GGDEF)-like protein